MAGHAEGEEKHVGGQAVKIGADGRVIAGPKWMKDAGITHLGRKTAKEPEEKGKGEEPALAPTPPAAPAAKPEEKPAAPATPKKYGKSKATVSIAFEATPEKLTRAMQKVFGRKAPPLEDMASLVGAPDDAAVEVGYTTEAGKTMLVISVEHEAFEARRLIFKNAAGVHIKNDEFWVNPTAQGKGLGTDVFGRQVEQCREMGIASIRCHAAQKNPREPSKPHNGYYTWPRFGYDADIEDENFDTPVYQMLRKTFPDADTLLDVMATPEGRKWWQKNGSDVYHMQFDLTEGSRSLRIFDAYLSERAALGR